ncbi:demethylspheroidene O-methyltransferase [Cognatiyoonia sediminum]|uniref:Demethylspheroidene O-methyltransferase n=1 Tax=Cognatiyoonia sediminum TaxID=1508389 RepID=A0A1M5Q5W8_9RHOB|nr:methyltransferase [Cognatiyoonia sediminum]SHH09544.1 demethylspheroidene O-methyltransferase [Cognatiyoonia sediminum]
MSDIGLNQPTAPSRKRFSFNRLFASPTFQRRMARLPLIKGVVRREGEEMFDIVAGFCHAQILQALIKLDILDDLLDGPQSLDSLSVRHSVPIERMRILLDASVSLNLLKSKRGGYALTRRGAALSGVPGLKGMIAHHDVLYRDLADPVAFFRGETETELAQFWPYVLGAGAAEDPAAAATYSKLMADSQALVAEDTLSLVNLDRTEHLMDVGGGTGAFLGHVAQAYPNLQLTLFDLPAVVPEARQQFADLGVSQRTKIVPGSFRDDLLPEGADTISLLRVLYDHADDTVLALLRSVYDALPTGGQILISEPMTGGAQPHRAGNAYFAIYCLAMQTGRARSAAEISDLLRQAGFANIGKPMTRRPFVTTAITAVKSN